MAKFVDGSSFGYFWIMLNAGWPRSADESIFVNVVRSRNTYVEEGAIPIMAVQILWSINVVWVVGDHGGLDRR
jgi:hypothetical protein